MEIWRPIPIHHILLVEIDHVPTLVCRSCKKANPRQFYMSYSIGAKQSLPQFINVYTDKK
jgi:hypothetical protein